MTSTEEPRLLALPAELRNRIYELALGNPIIDCKREATNPPGLLLACKQTHTEAIGIFYSLATFVGRNCVEVVNRMHLVQPKHRKLLKKVAVDRVDCSKLTSGCVLAHRSELEVLKLRHAARAFGGGELLHSRRREGLDCEPVGGVQRNHHAQSR